MNMKKRSKSLKFYCSGCTKDYTFKKYYSHKCKLSFHDRMKDIPSVFRCDKCHSVFAISQSLEAHETWCGR